MRSFLALKKNLKKAQLKASQAVWDLRKVKDQTELRNIRKAAELTDVTAREVIKKAGFGECFVHGLGHGVGLAVHEPPTLNWISKDVLKAGNVVTDEPGIYIVGFGGVRIEDTVLVQKDKAERLTHASYDLLI